jgi:Zn-dependent protease with chaperone function
MWQVLFLYQLIHFSRGIYRVPRLRREALLIAPSEIGMTGSGMIGIGIDPPHRVVLLESTAIDDPVTVGLFHPAIILPSKVIPALDEPDLAAILVHEYGHIRRKDFLVHLLCQLTALPVAWHTPVFST